MPAEVRVSDQVREYQRSLAPDSRRALKRALTGLKDGRGDIRALTDNLEGLHRLRVGTHRVVFRYRAHRIECFHAGPRRTVYEFLAAHLEDVFRRPRDP